MLPIFRKRIFGGLTLVAANTVCLASVTFAATPTLLLECKGKNYLGFEIEHEVAIYKNFAEFDGKRFSLEQSATEFTLKGANPSANPAPWNQGKPHANDIVIYINRLTGEYAITPLTSDGDFKTTEQSDKGAGCKKMNRQF